MFGKKKFVIGVLTVLLLAGCGTDQSGSENEGQSQEDVGKAGEEAEVGANGKVLATEDFDKMYTEPKKYKGYEVTYVGKVLSTPERDDDGVYLQVYAKPEKNEQNTIVAYADSSFEVDEGDYIKVTGVVKDQFVGENMLGAKLKIPSIEAKQLSVIGYIDAISPTLKTIEVNETKNQHGYQLTLEKIELAEKQTRVYFSVTNHSKHEINFYYSNSKIIANGKQLENISDYKSDLEEVQSDILPNTTSSGVVIYPAIDESAGKIQVYVKGHSDNYEVTIEPFMFDVNID